MEKHNRRTFLGATMLLSAGAVMARATAPTSVPSVSRRIGRSFIRPDELILPASLKKGSTIAVTAPASGVNRAELESGLQFLRNQGFHLELGKHVGSTANYLAASDKARADEFNDFARRSDIDAIICARGGYGVSRILPDIDYAAIRANPKIIMGYSDITALLVAIYERSRIVTYHGPVCSSSFDDTTKSSFVQVTMGNSLDENLGSGTTVVYSSDDLEVLHGGCAEARLVGGNLATICSTLGTPFEIDTRGAIFFLEDIAEEPYRIDRMLTQLWLSGKFDDVRGVVLGVFKSCEGIRRSPHTPTMSPSLKQVFKNRFTTMNVPVLSGLPFGHIKSKLTLPIGVRAKVDCSSKTFSLLEASVA
jgi:muramoyltetrapeptide carboxypeptidase